MPRQKFPAKLVKYKANVPPAYHMHGSCSNLFCPCGTLPAQPNDLFIAGIISADYADYLAAKETKK